MKKVSIIGLGYVGLPLAIAIAESKKYKVVGLDIDESKIASIKKGIPPFVDEEVEDRLKNVDINYTSDPSKIANSKYYIVAVPTPVHDDKRPNLKPLKGAVSNIAKYLKKGDFLIVESTINPGVCDEVVASLIKKLTGFVQGKDYQIVHCPERINPGDKKWNVYNIPRNIGASTWEGALEATEFYKSFLDSEINPVTSLKIAEATKIIENTFRDINIAYVNELAKSFDAMGIDLHETIQAASNKPFAFMPHWPGPGVGGHCIAVDPYYLIKRAAKSGFDHKFLKTARAVNNSMPAYVVKQLKNKFDELNLSKETKILQYGLSYKSNVGDLRESPALEVRKHLKKGKFTFKTYDPYIANSSDFETLNEALKWADVLLITTAHNEIKKLSMQKLSKFKLILDSTNCLNKAQIVEAGIAYKGVGR